MHTFKKLKFLGSLQLLILNLFFITCLSQHTSSILCGKIPIQIPFISSNSTVSSLLNHSMLCRSHKLYFRTSLGLFPVSSVNYTTKTLTISHPSRSSSQHFISPALLLAGFPTPLTPNSLLLFNCSSKNHPGTSFIGNCSRLKAFAASSQNQEQELEVPYSCLLVNDIEKLDGGFHPKDLNCSHYRLVYRSSSKDDDYSEYELGSRISFDIPDHVPDICNECQKPNGNCGVGLRCICHPKECKDKVISIAGSVKQFGNNVLISVLSFIVIFVSFTDF
ncbi:hypothetical protein JCGZ_11265 [Jatropha curcas]|uniref:Wall-associated receptor kinase C-terminal domain-containing protein n=1 Tax=Jatropha curcas TaxID=180498 RepID=A0A067KE41_JATCU|nr:uncharacterized protein LOC105637371 [Jatropha curcas]KDP34382.1 hypothetical protein JCGZ_11265 [Jatropha curcas]